MTDHIPDAGEKVREDFEAWAKTAGWPHHTTNTDDTHFYSGQSWAGYQAATQQSAARIEALEAEVLALRNDAERLDALESANVGSNMWITARGKDSFTVALKSPYGNCVTRKTLRDAIDAAIEAKRGEG